MISGRSDSGVTGPTPFVVGAAKGELEIGPAPYGSKTLAAGRKPGINSINDLKGKKGLTARFGNRCRIREKDPADREVVEKRRSIRQHPLPEPHSSAGLLIDRCLRGSRVIPFGCGSRKARQGAYGLQSLRPSADHFSLRISR